MTGLPRDRDPSGRPRNARPRDLTGRPLAPGTPGVDQVPDDVRRSESETLAEAQRLLDAGRPFAAHEVLEGRWKQVTAPSERALWRGLAQLMVGLTHEQRENRRGAQALLARGRDSLEDAADGHGVDVAAWRRWASAAAEAVGSGSPTPAPPTLAG